ncbi:hypothetical protein AYI68_g6846 [Smittium mucronatum]|uniref:Uncharacterized protein n=1 Tax=Smittium mucronatum TaxID=133383 RepID=A0A1R0GQE1_9FUNG|nr:hypothetical protein AYI68_g6846 [Smittium mucronatum]
MEMNYSDKDREYGEDLSLETHFNDTFEEVDSSFTMLDEDIQVKGGGNAIQESYDDEIDAESDLNPEKTEITEENKRKREEGIDETKKYKKKRMSNLSYEEQRGVIKSIASCCKDFSFAEFSSKYKAIQKLSKEEIILDIKLKTIYITGFDIMPVNELKVSLKNLDYDMTRIFFIKYEDEEVKMVIERTYLEEIKKKINLYPKFKIAYN